VEIVEAMLLELIDFFNKTPEYFVSYFNTIFTARGHHRLRCILLSTFDILIRSRSMVYYTSSKALSINFSLPYLCHFFSPNI